MFTPCNLFQGLLLCKLNLNKNLNLHNSKPWPNPCPSWNKKPLKLHQLLSLYSLKSNFQSWKWFLPRKRLTINRWRIRWNSLNRKGKTHFPRLLANIKFNNRCNNSNLLLSNNNRLILKSSRNNQPLWFKNRPWLKVCCDVNLKRNFDFCFN